MRLFYMLMKKEKVMVGFRSNLYFCSSRRLILLFMMKKNKKRKIYNQLKVAKSIQRDLEIKEYGKQVSLRPGSVFKSKKSYKRSKIKKEDINEDW